MFLVFWILVIAVCIGVGFGVAALFGNKIYDKANDIKDIYTKEEEKEEEKENEQER